MLNDVFKPPLAAACALAVAAFATAVTGPQAMAAAPKCLSDLECASKTKASVQLQIAAKSGQSGRVTGLAADPSDPAAPKCLSKAGKACPTRLRGSPARTK
jgi:hypothetical protein